MPLMLLLSAGLTIEKLDTYCTTIAPGVSGLALGTCGARFEIGDDRVVRGADAVLADAELAKERGH